MNSSLFFCAEKLKLILIITTVAGAVDYNERGEYMKISVNIPKELRRKTIKINLNYIKKQNPKVAQSNMNKKEENAQGGLI